MVLGYLELPLLFAGFSLIKVKSHNDIIQGISNLDLEYLLKVSIFQKYKE